MPDVSSTKLLKRPTLSQLSERTGLPAAHISKILNGRPCRLSTASLIAQAMGLTIDELYRDYIDNAERAS